MRLKRLLPFVVSLGIFLALFTAYRAWMVPLLTSELWSNVTPERRSVWLLRDEIMRVNERMRAIQLKDTVERVVPDSAGLFVVVPPGDASTGEYLRRIYMREVTRDATAAVGVVMLPFMFGGHSGFTDRWSGHTFVPGNVRGLPYCVVVIPYHAPGVEAAHIARYNMRRGTGPCGWWAKYGGPGPKIETWLIGGGSRFTQAQPSDYRPEDAGVPDGTESLFGRSNVRWWFSVPGQACLAGRVDACTSAVARADTFSSPFIMGNDYFRPRIMQGEGVLLTDLEKQFGAERFRAFWHSAQDVEPAFQAAFGVSIGQWTHDWATNRAGSFPTSPRMGVLTIVFAIMFVGLFVGIGAAVANRRRL